MTLNLFEAGAIRIVVKYLEQKNGKTWYFRRRIPDDVRHLYPNRSTQIYQSLKTSSGLEATRKADLMARQQDALWKAHRNGSEDLGPDEVDAARGLLGAYGLRPGQYKEYDAALIEPTEFLHHLAYLSDGGGEVVREDLPRYAEHAAELFYGLRKDTPTLKDAMRLHQELNGELPDSRAGKDRLRVVEQFASLSGNQPLDAYRRDDARSFVSFYLDQGKKTHTVRRYVNYVAPVFATGIREYELRIPNIFDNVKIPKLGEDAKVRVPFTADEILTIGRWCREQDDEDSRLVAIIMDTGVRLSEASGLLMSDVFLDAPVPHIFIRENAVRRIKGKTTERRVPLVGGALWGARKLVSATSNEYLVSSSSSGDKTAFTGVSNRLAIKIREIGIDKTSHSFRHAVRDRLRNAGADTEVAFRIGGWSLPGVGNKYGQGHSLEVLQGWMERIIADPDW